MEIQNYTDILDAILLSSCKIIYSSETLSQIKELLSEFTNRKREYATMQAATYERWVRLIHKKTDLQRHTQKTLAQLQAHNGWLRENVENLKILQDETRQKARSQQSEILKQLQQRAAVELEKKLSIEKQIKCRLDDVINSYEMNLCKLLDEISSLKRRCQEIEDNQNRQLMVMAETLEATCDEAERVNKSKLKDRQREIRKLHSGCRACLTQESEEFLSKQKKLQKTLNQLEKTRNALISESVSDVQKMQTSKDDKTDLSIEIEDSDEDE